MPGSDSYYSALSKGNQLSDGQNPANSNPYGGGRFNVDPNGYSQAQAGGSPGQAGSGFVNLSQLLSLNGASGQASANSAASSLAKQGQAAQSGIKTAQDQFNKSVYANTVNADNVINGGSVGQVKASDQTGKIGAPGATQGSSQQQNTLDNVKNALDAANRGYNGPSSLADDPGYGQLSKQVSDAQNRATNDSSGAGMAAQIAQDTGLSPRQSAASAFYEGVTNGRLQGTAKKWSGLGSMLNKANSDSVNAADLARQDNQAAAVRLNDYYNSKTQKPQTIGQAPRPVTAWDAGFTPGYLG